MLSKERKYIVSWRGKLEPVNHIVMAVLWGGIQRTGVMQKHIKEAALGKKWRYLYALKSYDCILSACIVDSIDDSL